MHRFLQLFICFLFPLNLFAQVDWAHHIGSGDPDNLEHLAIDHEGNTIAVGYFGERVTIGNKQFISTGDSDIFVYKASPAGNVIWAKALSSPSHTGDAGIAVDKLGNIYLAGGFIEQLNYEGKTILTGNANWNSFLCKLDKNGTLLWVKGIIGTNAVSDARVLGTISANEMGEVAVAANFSGIVTVGGNSLTSNGEGGNNLVIAKFSADGNLAWYNTPVSATNTEVKGIKLSNDGQVYFTGAYTSNLILDSYKLEVSTYGYGEIFVAKLDVGGKPLWAKSFNKTLPANLNNTGRDIVFDEQTNELYIVGDFKGKIGLDAITISGINTSEDPGTSDIFLAKLTATGNVVWGKRIGSLGHDFSRSLAQKTDGALVISGALDFKPFMHQYTKDGTFISGYVLNTNGWVNNTIHISNDQYYIGGVFWGTFQEEVFNWNAVGSYDGFMLKVGNCQSEVSLPEKPVLQSNCTAITYKNYTGFGTIEWYKNEVKIETATGNELLNPETGYYQVSVRNNCGITYSDKLYFDKEVGLPQAPEIKQVNCKMLQVLNHTNQAITWYKQGILIQGNNTSMFTFAQGGVYTVRFTNECGYTENSITVDAPNTLQNYTFYNVITPNGDDKNELFLVDSALLSSSLQVYNRWGSKVYESKQYQNDWGGTGLASGVYFWTIDNECLGLIRGTITIIR